MTENLKSSYYLQPCKIMRDAVYGYINLTAFDIKIIDTVEFQRLKDIRQLTCHHVYPEARHTRFEHSLGVMELVRNAMRGLNQNGIIGKSLDSGEKFISESLYFNTSIAALLHDVGHCPFSHTGEIQFDAYKVKEELEKIIKANKITDLLEIFQRSKPKELGAVHEQLSCIIILKRYKGLLDHLDEKVESDTQDESCSIDVDYEFIIRCILGIKYKLDIDNNNDSERLLKNALISLINSNIFDMDKLDYIMRDSYFTDIGCPSIDTKRLFKNMYFDEHYSIVFTNRAVPSLQNMIEARDGLYMYVYNHHAVIFSDFLNNYICRKITHNTKLYEAICNNIEIKKGQEKAAKQLKNLRAYKKDDYGLVGKEYLFSCEAITDKHRSDSDWIALTNNLNLLYKENESKIYTEDLFPDKIYDIDNEIKHEIDDLNNKIKYTVELVQQLKTRTFLKPWWKTVFEYTNFMNAHFPDDDVRDVIGHYICKGGYGEGKNKIQASEFRSQIVKHVAYITKKLFDAKINNQNQNEPLLAPLSNGELFIIERSTRFFGKDKIKNLLIYLKPNEIIGTPTDYEIKSHNYYGKRLTNIIPQKDYSALYAEDGFYVFSAPIKQCSAYQQLDNKDFSESDLKEHYKRIENIFVFVVTEFVKDGEEVFVRKFKDADKDDSGNKYIDNKKFIEKKEEESMEEFYNRFKTIY